ncbi:DUF167 family protein [Sphingomonas sp. S6]|jgi:uncharacterized protein (TIGR00251 family)|uniref:DUF167 domain-containing protein n=1 Tax=Sphingomonas sp. S6 TaxID=3368600 RepID=UPI000FAA0066|nr:DUF167 family protein [uncultured Sphingomonas sp.]RTL21240.1 MAG: DUF167 domain-containing protein [Sphingomonadaceae bacterium]
MPAWAVRDDGIVLAVRVTPRSGRDALLAGTDEHFVARLAAAPVDGKANAALLALVADRFSVPKRAVVLIGGDTARLKRLHVAGDAAVLAKTAAALYDVAP